MTLKTLIYVIRLVSEKAENLSRENLLIMPQGAEVLPSYNEILSVRR